MWCGWERNTVKPSAQPTLVRTQHLPPPAKTARSLRKRGPAGRFLLVTPYIRVCHCGSTCCGVHGRIADGVCAIRTVGAHRRLFHGRPRTGPRGAHPGFVCSAEPGARARTRAAAGGARCARREAGSLRSDLLPGWRLVDGRISGKSRAQGGWRRGPSGRAAGSVAARHANCRSAGGAARCGGRRAARGAYGRPCRIRALAGLPGCNSDVPADGLRVPGSAVCSAWVPGELAARV